ncbi:MAG: agmatine deiminase [Verrucomicrobiales bacterium]
MENSPGVFVALVQKLQGHIPITALVNDVEEYHQAKGLLKDNALPLQSVTFLEVERNTMWVRDYGPMILETDSGSPLLLDAKYSKDRAEDDRVPATLAESLNLTRVTVPYVIEGGNLLTNGNRLAIMTSLISDESIHSQEDHERYLNIFTEFYGMKEVVVLESLLGEPTGHVDMFATFTSTDTVIVGSYPIEEDAENAAILDRNTARLAEVKTDNGPLNVIRIPMPTHKDGIWRTYTNVIYANGLLLVPTYPLVDVEAQMQALSIFKEALPGWQIEGIDASQVIESNGALHCCSEAFMTVEI